jgi:hypothetical protein
MINKNNVTALQLEPETCTSTGYQPATVCTPVTVTPFADAGDTTTFCCGDPIITPGAAVCAGTRNGSCTFTITQDICIEVPIEFGANAVTGDTFVECGEASAEDICANCGEDLGGVGVQPVQSKSCPTCKSR